MAISEKLTYLSTTKSKIKDVINMTGVGIANDTFRSYAQSLYDGYIATLQDKGTLLDNMNKGTSTGTISGSANLPVYEYKASKLSTQETTTGKNLFDLKSFITNSGETYTENDDGSLTFHTDQDMYSSPISFSETDINVSIGGLVTLVSVVNFRIDLLNSSNTRVARITTDISKVENVNACKLRFDWGTAGNVTLKNVMLNTGTTLQPYEPYTNGPSPNPNYPQEVNTVKGYRNLFNINGDVNTRYNGQTGTSNTVNDNDLTTTASVQAIVPFGQKIYVGAGNSITLSGILKKITYDVEPSASNTVGVLILYNDNTTTGYKSLTFNYNEIGTRKFTSFTATTDYIFVTFGIYNNSRSVTFTDIQVVIGEDKPYVPYGTNWIYTTISDGTNSRNVTIPLNNNEICGIGDYKDELVIDKYGHAKLNKKIGKITYDGTEDWSMSDNKYLVSQAISDILTSLTNVYCNIARYIGFSELNANTDNRIALRSTYRQFWLRLSQFATKDDFKTWLTTHTMYVYYPLATPTEIDLGNIDMELYEGTNNITNSENMDMSIRFIKDTYE